MTMRRMNTHSANRHADSPLSATAPSTSVTLTAEQLADLTRQLRAPPPQLLTDDESAAFLGISVRRFHELRHEEWMPAPKTFGPRSLRWSRAELEAAIEKMPRQSKLGPEPTQLAKGRAARAGRTDVR
jgi:predicted DNA-binding transcriptional regulator AlpA